MLTSSYILYKFEGFQKEFLRNYYNYVHRSVGSRSSDKGGGGGGGGEGGAWSMPGMIVPLGGYVKRLACPAYTLLNLFVR